MIRGKTGFGEGFGVIPLGLNVVVQYLIQIEFNFAGFQRVDHQNKKWMGIIPFRHDPHPFILADPSPPRVTCGLDCKPEIYLERETGFETFNLLTGELFS